VYETIGIHQREWRVGARATTMARMLDFSLRNTRSSDDLSLSKPLAETTSRICGCRTLRAVLSKSTASRQPALPDKGPPLMMLPDAPLTIALVARGVPAAIPQASQRLQPNDDLTCV
jgi:hypothetical protein